jgi:hypothetical protein
LPVDVDHEPDEIGDRLVGLNPNHSDRLVLEGDRAQEGGRPVTLGFGDRLRGRRDEPLLPFGDSQPTDRLDVLARELDKIDRHPASVT